MFFGKLHHIPLLHVLLTTYSVRDGDLHKTPKILQSIATGTPIVVDKWLTDSAKAGHFLSVDAYRKKSGISSSKM
jgi:hypothetical protein